MLNRIMGLNPWVEVAIRTAYRSGAPLHPVLAKLRRPRKADTGTAPPDALPPHHRCDPGVWGWCRAIS